jgi:hypothetical protein
LKSMDGLYSKSSLKTNIDFAI